MVLKEPMIEESVTASISSSPDKPRYRLSANVVKKSEKRSVVSSKLEVSVKASNSSMTKEESSPGMKISSVSRLSGLSSSPSPGMSQVLGCKGNDVSCSAARNRSNSLSSCCVIDAIKK